MRTSKKIFISSALTSLLCLSQASHAFPYNNEWWLNAGVGAAAGTNSGVPLPPIPSYIYNAEKNDAENVGGPAGEASLNLALTQHTLATARYVTSNNWNGNYGEGYFREAGLLYGVMAKARYGYISASAGVSYVNTGYTSGTDYLGVTFHDPDQKTIGVPGEIQAFFTPIPYVGIGIIGFGDYNSHAPVAGAVLALQIGNLY
jgi:hypothetical protein